MKKDMKKDMKKFTLTLPIPKGKKKQIPVETLQSVLFVGANGSGKTRLGTWIDMESPLRQRNKVYRISAQKSLELPDSVTVGSTDEAQQKLLYGYPQRRPRRYSYPDKEYRWDGSPATTTQDDYRNLMSYLFSEAVEESDKYKNKSKKSKDRIVPPITQLDRVKELWERILPHRELIINGVKIQTRIKGQKNKVYDSAEMSDGERVIFYLISQCLAAPKDGIIVIDEPELHINKSVQSPLWDAIENLRKDCLFVYLTHDVDFAAAKTSAKKVWIKSFDGQYWDWEIIEEDENLPDELLIEVLGSRRPVVFVEGENGSLDVSLYRELLSNFLVIPKGSCAMVIQSVKALRANKQIHRLDVYGLIDRDRRSDDEIKKLEKHFIYVLKVAEVENLFCTKEILKIVSTRMGSNPVADFKKASTIIYKGLWSEIDEQVSLRVLSEIKFRLNIFNTKKTEHKAMNKALRSLVENIDVKKIYLDTYKLYSNILDKKDYEELLALYNRKSLSSRISGSLKLKNGTLPGVVIQLVRNSDCREEIKNVLKPYLGNFQQHMDAQ